MVAFLSPKKSKVDIVQAIGRAMRKSGSKEVGYVLIPLYLEQKAGESLEEAVGRANFEEVWDILQSLQEQDEVLAELIRDMAVAKGSSKGFDDSRFSDRIAFTGPVLALESIRQAVTTRVLERLESSWDVNFGKLVKFKEEHGHCRVLRNIQDLGSWVKEQRKKFAAGKLNPDRASRLDSVGFDWDVFDLQWDSNFELLKSFYTEHGHCRVQKRSKADKSLGIWVAHQRALKSKGQLTDQRISKLDSLEFEWDLLSVDWNHMFSLLTEYHSSYGNCQPSQTSKNHKDLGLWVRRQRRQYRLGKLSPERIKNLEALGFEWEVR